MEPYENRSNKQFYQQIEKWSRPFGNNFNFSAAETDLLTIDEEEDTVYLNSAKKRWKPSRERIREYVSDKEYAMDNILKAIRALLNKVMDNKLDFLLIDVKKLTIDTTEKLENIVDILFEKSISDPCYTSTYAKICKFFSKNYARIGEGFTPKEKSKKKNLVKNCLINRCQHELTKNGKYDTVCFEIELESEKLEALFERAHVIEDQLKGSQENDNIKLKDTIHEIEKEVKVINSFISEVALFLNKKNESAVNNAAEDDNEDPTSVNMMRRIVRLITSINRKIIELEDYRWIIQNRSNGIVKFVGELFRVGLLTTGIMNSCIEMLLPKDDITPINEDNLDRLCKLLSSIGCLLGKANSSSLDKAFEKFNELIDINCDAIKTAQIKLDVMNIVKLRESAWKVGANNRQTNSKNSYSSGVRQNDVHVVRPNFDLSRLPGQSNFKSEIELAPTNHGNMFTYENQQASKQNLPPRQALKPMNNHQNDSNGPELYYGRRNYMDKENQQTPQQYHPPGQPNSLRKLNTRPPFPIKIQNKQQDAEPPVEIVEEFTSKAAFESYIKAVYDGKLTTDQMLVKMKGYKLGHRVLCDLCCDFFDKKQPQRRALMQNLLELFKRGFVTKEVIVQAFEEIVKFAPGFLIKFPHVFKYIEEYFVELIKGELFTREDIQYIYKDDKTSAKFCSILGTNPLNSDTQVSSHAEEQPIKIENVLQSSSSTASDDSSNSSQTTMSLPEQQPGSQVIEPNEEEKIALTNDDLQAPPGVQVRSFKQIESNFLIHMKKAGKDKNEFDRIFDLVNKKNCNYHPTFIQDMTKCLLEIHLDKKQVAADHILALENSLPFLKRFIASSLSRQLRCIHALQAYVYETNYPDLLKTLFGVFHEYGIISYEAFFIWKNSMGEISLKNNAILGTNSFFQKLEAHK